MTTKPEKSDAEKLAEEIQKLREELAKTREQLERVDLPKKQKPSSNWVKQKPPPEW